MDQPVRVNHAVVVCVGEQGATGFLHAEVARGAEAGGFLAEGAHGGVGFDDVRDGIGGAVIDDEGFEFEVAQAFDGLQAGGEGFGAVAGADDDGDGEGVDGGIETARQVGEEGASGAGLAVGVDDAELPTGDEVATAVPFVGEGEPDAAGRAGMESDLALPAHDFGLFFDAVGFDVETEFGDEEGFVAGEVLEAVQVGGEGGGIFEVDVDREEVGGARHEVAGGRVGGVAAGDARGGAAHGGDEAFEEVLDTAGSHPADQAFVDFIADEDGGDGGISGEIAGLFGDGVEDGGDLGTV